MCIRDSEYVAIESQPQYARGQIIMLRRANCKMFFPQLAQWHSELDRGSLQVCQRVWISVTIGLRHLRRLPRGALGSDAVPY
eukprot:6297998-Alexandrium_andersonii.AAC.1